jgi:hypothetical protein
MSNPFEVALRRAHHHVVNEVDPNMPCGFAKLASRHLILRAWRRVSARTIVRDDDRCRIRENRGSEHFARMS